MSSSPSGIEYTDRTTGGGTKVRDGFRNDDGRSEEVQGAAPQNRQPDQDAEMKLGDEQETAKEDVWHRDDIREAQDLYREIRVDNELTDDRGEKASLGEGAEVDVVLEADSDATIKNLSESLTPPVYCAALRSLCRMARATDPIHALAAPPKFQTPDKCEVEF